MKTSALKQDDFDYWVAAALQKSAPHLFTFHYYSGHVAADPCFGKFGYWAPSENADLRADICSRIGRGRDVADNVTPLYQFIASQFGQEVSDKRDFLKVATDQVHGQIPARPSPNK